MLATASPRANPFPFPVATAPLGPDDRDALLPRRLTAPWTTARWIDEAVDRLDLSCLAPLYRRRGSLPFSPLLMLKLALFCIADGLPSPADWAEMANRDGPCRWLAWGIEPSCSACYSFRDRLGVDHLLEINRQALALARADGLSPTNRGAIDGTLQEASASRHRMADQARLERGLSALDEGPAPAPTPPPPIDPVPDAAAPDAAAAAAPDAAAPARPETPQQSAAGGPVPKRPRLPARPGRTGAGRDDQKRRWRRAKERLEQRKARNAEKRSSKRTDPAKMVISPVDPEAAVGRDKRGVFRPLYNVQLVADLDSDLILGYEALAQPNDNGLLPVMLEASERLLGRKLDLALVDAGYTGGRELAEAERAGVAVLGPCAGQGGGKGSAKQIPKEDFRYEAGRDVYVCPEGEDLGFAGRSRQKRSSVELVVLSQYRAAEGACASCPRKQECCPKSESGRSISRSEHEGSIEALRGRMSEAENKRTYKRRAATVERLFGDGKECRGLGRVAGRGLKQARIQLALTVLQHNLRVMAKADETKRKKGDAPQDYRRSA